MSTSETSAKFFYQHRRSIVEEAIMILLIVLSLVGIGVMNFSPTDGYFYWIAMILVFGLAALATSFLQAKEGVHVIRNIWIEQSLHWFGALLATGGTLILLKLEIVNDHGAGLVVLLILSLAVYLDGIRIGWRFGLIGNFLGLTAIVIPSTPHFMWVLFAIALVTISLTVYLDKRRTANG